MNSMVDAARIAEADGERARRLPFGLNKVMGLFGIGTDKATPGIGFGEDISDGDFATPRKSKPPVRFSRLADYLPYHSFDPKHRLFFIEGPEPGTVESVGFVIEIRPQLGATEEMADYLTSLFQAPGPAGTGIQVQIFGTPDLEEFFKRYEAVTLQATEELQAVDPERARQRRLLTKIMEKRLAYYRKGATEGLFRDMNFRMRDFRANCSVVVPVPKKGMKGEFQRLEDWVGSDEARILMEQVELTRETYTATLKSYHLYLRDWGPEELINWCSQLLNMQQTLSGEIPSLTYDDSLPLSHQIVARDTKMVETEMDLQMSDGRNDQVHARAMSIRSYPKGFSLNQMSELLGSATNPTLSYPCPFLLTLGVQILEYDAEKNKTMMKAARATQGAESQMAKFQPDMVDRKFDWDIALDAFNEGKGTVKLYHQLMLFAKEGEIAKAEQAARAIWRGQNFDITVDRKMQKQGLLSSLPMTFGPLMQGDLKAAMRCSTKTVFNAANMMPTLGEHTGLGTPTVSLFGRRGQAMSIDLHANPSGNYNGCVVGASGAGKSFLLCEIAGRMVATGGKARIIDVGRSYENLCKTSGGQYIEFTPDSDICLNPFSMVEDIDRDMEMLKPLLGQMISPSKPLDDYQLAQVEINVRQLWEEHGRNTTITMLAERLKKACYQGGSREAFGVEADVPTEACDPRIRDLGVQLFPFTSEGAYGRFFEGEANINFKSDFVVLELEELKSMKALQGVVMLLIMYKISQEMYLGGRSQKGVCIIDEAWDVMAGGQSGAFIEAGYRRARKYGWSFLTGTQSVGDYSISPTAQAAFDNADWMFLLRQKKESIESLSRSGRLSMDDYTKTLISSVTTRHGAYSEVFVRCADMPPAVGRLFVDPFSQLMNSTKAEDFEAIRSLTRAGIETETAIEMVLKQRGITV